MTSDTYLKLESGCKNVFSIFTWLTKTLWQLVFHTTILVISSLTILFLLYPDRFNLTGPFNLDEFHAFTANYIIGCGLIVGMLIILNLCAQMAIPISRQKGVDSRF